MQETNLDGAPQHAGPHGRCLTNTYSPGLFKGWVTSEKCVVVRLFRPCVHTTEYTHTNLDGPGYYTPRL